jgi:hypothetical protein
MRCRRHDCEGRSSSLASGRLLLAMYFATVVWPTSIPSLSSSPCIRGAPHNGLATLISRMRWRMSAGVFGRPPRGPISSASTLGNRHDANGLPSPVGRFSARQAPWAASDRVRKIPGDRCCRRPPVSPIGPIINRFARWRQPPWVSRRDTTGHELAA